MTDLNLNEAKAILIKSPQSYLNRELSLLSFQRRLLEEAQDERNPLLERIKFLAIIGSNMEEFFMVRVGSIRMQYYAGITELSSDGLTPAEQLAEIRKAAMKVMEDARQYWLTKLMPGLREVGVFILDYNELNEKQKETANDYFKEVVYPVLTPLAFDSSHPFPHISNLSLNIAVHLRGEEGQMLFARVKVPNTLPQFVPIKKSSGSTRKNGTAPYNHYFVWLSQLIIANLQMLFPGIEAIEAYPFHITRNSDIVVQELEALDLLETMEESVRKRRFGEVVCMIINKDMPKHTREILAENMDVDSRDIYALDGPLALSSLMELIKIDRYDLKDKPFIPVIPPLLRMNSQTTPDSIFANIRQGDILLHHPYDSFEPVINFLKAAATDPNVLAIKQTLYRVGRNSPVVDTLLQAARDYGKQVAVLVELKARFDEESNIGWAKAMEQEGIHVTYGLLGLKTHSKIGLVVRKEGERIRRYIHLSTGNYNHVTAQIYEDVGIFTCDDEIGADATDLFNYLTGYSLKNDYRKLLVAPINLRSRFEELIRQEIEHQNHGENGHIILKMNALIDEPMIDLLYQASQAGVKVDLIVRGMCCLKPGVKGLSENIQVRSIVGRFLEHSRIYYFRNAGNEKILMGSADLMPRNLDRRVEILYPIENPAMIQHIRDNILSVYLTDNSKAHLMASDGSYKRLVPTEGQQEVIAQEWFMNQARLTGER